MFSPIPTPNSNSNSNSNDDITDDDSIKLKLGQIIVEYILPSVGGCLSVWMSMSPFSLLRSMESLWNNECNGSKATIREYCERFFCCAIRRVPSGAGAKRLIKNNLAYWRLEFPRS